MLTLVLRFAHVFIGALWVGMMAFQVLFLMPALADVGPDAGKVMGAIMKRRLPIVMPLFGLITVVSGMWLFQRLSGGNVGALMASPMGKAFGFGGAIALLAFLIGVATVRPMMMKSVKLGEALASASPAQRAPIAAELQKVRARGAVIGKLVTAMLLVTLALMSVARYL